MKVDARALVRYIDLRGARYTFYVPLPCLGIFVPFLGLSYFPVEHVNQS